MLVEEGNDVGTGTTKANTAILHTGFDAVPGSLESQLVRRGAELLRGYAVPAAGIPLERTGAVLIAWSAEQEAELPAIQDKARRNGYLACRRVSAAELARLMAPSAVDRVYAESLSRMAAGYLVRNYVSGTALGIGNTRSLTPQQCVRAIEHIEECLGDSLTLEGIAKAAGVSTGRLNSEFKRSMKVAPYQYVLNARVRRASASTDVDRFIARANRSSMRVQQPATHNSNGPPYNGPYARRDPPEPLAPARRAQAASILQKIDIDSAIENGFLAYNSRRLDICAVVRRK